MNARQAVVQMSRLMLHDRREMARSEGPRQRDGCAVGRRIWRKARRWSGDGRICDTCIKLVRIRMFTRWAANVHRGLRGKW
jgi:hypothetical protein